MCIRDRASAAQISTAALVVVIGIAMWVLIAVARPDVLWKWALILGGAAAYVVMFTVRPLAEFFMLDIGSAWAMTVASGAVALGIVPVSYTHLDVYKRQEQAETIGAQGLRVVLLGSAAGSVADPDSLGAVTPVALIVLAQKAVSYTHLDVYKRQRRGGGAARGLAARVPAGRRHLRPAHRDRSRAGAGGRPPHLGADQHLSLIHI